MKPRNRYRLAGVLGLLVFAMTASPVRSAQTIYVDFDSIKDAYDADPGGPGLPPADEIYVYSTTQRETILDTLNSHFEMYGMLFLEGPRPVVFADSQVTVNKGFGAGSDGVDFRNLNHDDDAFINAISIFKFFGKTAGDWTDDDVVQATVNLVGHEASHLQGARHHDALNPINHGLGGGIAPGDFLPGYPGPSDAGDTGITFASQHAGGSLSFESVIEPKYVSERVIPRLIVADSGGDSFHTDETATDNHTVDMAQYVPTPAFSAPYPLRPPLAPGETVLPVGIDGFAATVAGTLDLIPESPPETPAFLSDYYAFDAMAGQVWTIEAMSYILELGERYADGADVAILLLNEFGDVVPYHTGDAINDDDDDSGGVFFGASLIDVVIPVSGTYVIEVVAAAPFLGTGKDGTDGGSYELFLYSGEVLTVTIPEPGTLGLLLLSASGLWRHRARRCRSAASASLIARS